MALQNDPAAARAAVRNAAPTARPGRHRRPDHHHARPRARRPAPTSTTVRLTITYPMPFLTGFFGSGVTLRGTGVMRCNG